MMMMKEMVSGIATIPADTSRQIKGLKQAQDEATNRLASDTTGLIGVGDTDLARFLTPPFKSMRMLQVKSGPQFYGTLGLIPNQGYRFDGVPYYRDGSVRAIDRAGTANITSNIVRTGPAPDGYTRGETILIQKRIARTFNPNIDRTSYAVEVREVPADYVLQPDERYDGDFSPVNGLGLGLEYLSVYPVDAQGRRLYNGDPYTEAGWDGTTYRISYNPETIPVITSVDPPNFQLPDNSGDPHGFIFGRNIAPTAMILVGPYRTQVDHVFVGFVSFTFPGGMQPGVYDFLVVGTDGQIGIASDPVTVLAEV
jgi:hypothetical protein